MTFTPPSFSLETLSTNNSSTTNIAASASFTGTADNVEDFETIGVSFFSDQPCTIQVQQSSNGTNWDIVDSYTVAASTGDARSFVSIAQFCRIVVTNNGGSTTTALRLQTLYSPNSGALPRSLTQLGNFKTSVIEPLPAGTNNIGSANTGIVQTTAPAPKTTGTNTLLTTDEYSRASVVFAEEMNSKFGQMFSLSTGQVALTGTGEVPLLLFKNPTGSGKNAKIYRVSFQPTLGNNYVTYRIYLNPTVTANGTVLNVNGSRQTGQNSTIINAFTVPTVSSNGTLIRTDISSGLAGVPTQVPYAFSLWLEPNNIFMITRQLSANATIGGINLEWAEQ